MNFHFYVDYSKYYKVKYELFILGQIIYFTNLFKSDGKMSCAVLVSFSHLQRKENKWQKEKA